MNVSMIKGEDINFGDNLTMTVLMSGIVGMALHLELQKSMSPKGMMLRTSKIWISN